MREMILYVAQKGARMERFGKTKLNKILWKADFAAFSDRGSPVTGRPYQKLGNGPAPVEMPTILAEMEADGLIEIVQVQVGSVTEHRVIAKTDPTLRFFSPDDLRFVDLAIEYFWETTATEASDLSHGVAWKTRAEMDPLPYESSILADDQLAEPVLSHLKTMAQERGWKSH